MKSPLILLHGALGSEKQLFPLKELLSGSFDVHTFDFEGHGDRRTDHPYSIELFAENLSNYIKTHKLTNVTVFGYSMGGYVALKLAATEPNLIAKIATLGTKFDWNPESAAKEAKMLDPDKILEKVPKYADYLQTLHGTDHWKNVLQRTAAMMIDLGNGHGLTGEELGSIRIPVQIGIGEKDQMVSLEESQRVADLIPGSDLHIYAEFLHPIDRIDLNILSGTVSEFLLD